jgi:hypothetical protein
VPLRVVSTSPILIEGRDQSYKVINLKMNDAHLLPYGVQSSGGDPGKPQRQEGDSQAICQEGTPTSWLASRQRRECGVKTGVLATKMSDICQDKKLHTPRLTEQRAGSLPPCFSSTPAPLVSPARPPATSVPLLAQGRSSMAWRRQLDRDLDPRGTK